MSRIIVIQGAPAVGKSTLANELRSRLDIGILAKDDIKELLYDRLGSPQNRRQSQLLYGVGATEALYAIAKKCIEQNVDFILESAFYVEHANKDIENILRLNKDQGSVTQLYCHTTPKLQAERFAQRLVNESRHTAHFDVPKSAEELIAYNNRYAKLAIEPCIDVDTTELYVSGYDKLAQKIKSVW